MAIVAVRTGGLLPALAACRDRGRSVRDALTVVCKATYTVNSNEQWVSVQPDDGVYDTTLEAFTIRIDDLKSDSNVIAVSVADDVSNTQYKTYEVEIP